MPITLSAEPYLEQFQELLTGRVNVVAVTQISNVTGTIYPVAKITRLAHERGIPVVVDGAQGPGIATPAS